MTWNAHTRELLGHRPDEPLDYEYFFLARVHTEDLAQVITINEKALSPDGDGTTETKYRTINAVNGSKRWIHARGALGKGPVGSGKFVGTVRDITAENRLRRIGGFWPQNCSIASRPALRSVQSIVSQSLRSAATPEEACDAIGKRLATLA